MQTVLIVIHLMIVLALVGVVLIQRSEGGGLGIGGGSGFMSARGTANALTRTTAILAALFFLHVARPRHPDTLQGRPTDILDRIPATAGQGNGILDSLGENGATAGSRSGSRRRRHRPQAARRTAGLPARRPGCSGSTCARPNRRLRPARSPKTVSKRHN